MQLNEKNILKSAKALALCAMLCAMSVIIGITCKTCFNFGKGLFRITFENLPIIITGLSFGPLVGGLVGLGTDLISYLLSPQIYPPNPIVTLGAILVGVSAGLVGRATSHMKVNPKIVISTLISHLVGSMIVKSIGLYQFYGIMVLVRIPTYMIISSIEAVLICIIYKNPKIRRILSIECKNGEKDEL